MIIHWPTDPQRTPFWASVKWAHKLADAADLADLYGVSTKRLNEAVRRNAERFPEDFMFQLSREEADSLNAVRTWLRQLPPEVAEKIARGNGDRLFP